MSEMASDLAPVEVVGIPDASELPGIIPLLGELKPGALIFEEALARLFSRHRVSVKRAVQDGHLPPPTRLFGKNVWTAGSILRHIEARLEQAAKQQERQSQRIAKLSP